MRRRPVKQRTRCSNTLCNVPLAGAAHRFCPSCRYMARRTKARWFPIAVIVGGIVWGVIQKVFF